MVQQSLIMLGIAYDHREGREGMMQLCFQVYFLLTELSHVLWKYFARYKKKKSFARILPIS